MSTKESQPVHMLSNVESKSSAEISAEDLVHQMARMLQSSGFRHAPMMQRFLEYIVCETLAGRRDNLHVNGIARHVLNRGSGFNNEFDSSVRVAGYRLRKTIALYNSTEGASDEYLIELNPGSYVPVFTQRQRPESMDTARQAVFNYQSKASLDSFRTAFELLEKRVKSNPDDAFSMAHYGSLLLDAHLHGYENNPHRLDQAWRAVDRACELELTDPDVQFINGLFGLASGDLDRVNSAGIRIVRSCSDPLLRAQGTWLISLASVPGILESERAITSHQADFELDWLHHIAFLRLYLSQDYEGALVRAIAFGMPDFFWGPLERSAALGMLGLTRAAEIELQRATFLNPGLLTNPDLYLSYYIPHQDVRDHVVEGLEKAGLSRLAR